MIYRASFLFVLLYSYTSTFAQLNVKVGLQGEYSNNVIVNSLLNTYNAKNVSSSFKGFKTVSTLYGLDLGLRYKVEELELETGFLLYTNPRRATFTQPDNSKLYFKLNPRVDNYYFGLNYAFNSILGVGVAASYSDFRFIGQKTTEKNSSQYGRQSIFGTTFSFFYQVPSNSFLGLRIKPYFYYPFQHLSTIRLSELLDLGSTEQLQHSWSVGLALVLYNGRQ